MIRITDDRIEVKCTIDDVNIDLVPNEIPSFDPVFNKKIMKCKIHGEQDTLMHINYEQFCGKCLSLMFKRYMDPMVEIDG